MKIKKEKNDIYWAGKPEKHKTTIDDLKSMMQSYIKGMNQNYGNLQNAINNIQSYLELPFYKRIFKKFHIYVPTITDLTPFLLEEIDATPLIEIAKKIKD